MLAGENNWLGGGQNMQEAILASSAKVTKVMEFTFVVVIKIIRSGVGTRKQENKNITLSDVLHGAAQKFCLQEPQSLQPINV